MEKIGLERVGVVFFKNYFKLAPENLQLTPFNNVPNLYQSDILRTNGLKVAKAIGKALSSLEDDESAQVMTKNLAKLLKDLGVHPDHYAALGKAIVTTLQAGLKSKFPPEVKQAWEIVY